VLSNNVVIFLSEELAWMVLACGRIQEEGMPKIVTRTSVRAAERALGLYQLLLEYLTLVCQYLFEALPVKSYVKRAQH